ncbi:YqfQ-like protein [Alteribacillus persepolensis]|uniref:YqfQ-like protein n=2 Tax=Alteribacillus persepolensis TaxID=568899 RepID=A0A1G8CTB3_9BACI|nr:YqfQ-like protein [Alteribacillus persepolensis]
MPPEYRSFPDTQHMPAMNRMQPPANAPTERASTPFAQRSSASVPFAGRSLAPLASLATQQGGLSNIVPSVQKMINVAQTVTPMVKQYYPLVKQLPALWSMLSSTTNDSSHIDTNYQDNPGKEEISEPFPEPAAESDNKKAESYFAEAPPPKLYV